MSPDRGLLAAVADTLVLILALNEQVATPWLRGQRPLRLEASDVTSWSPTTLRR